MSATSRAVGVSAGHRRVRYARFVEIDHEGREFPYRQLAAILRARIKDGTYRPGKPIPSLTHLTGEYGLALTTVRRAIDILEEEGLVERIAGRGTFVTRPQDRDS